MASLTEILILRGILPIERLGSGDVLRADDETALLALRDEGLVTPSQLVSARAAQIGIPFVELLDHTIDHTVVALVPAALCRRHGVIPISRTGDTITVAMVDPGDVVALDDVRAASRLRVRVVLGERGALEAAIDRFYRADGELDSLTATLAEESASSTSAGAGGARPGPAAGSDDDTADDDAPIVRFVNLLISQAIQDLASDIHI